MGLDCLALLADVMSLCLQPADQDESSAPAPSPPRASRVGRWKHLLSELLAWHNDRPPVLKELVDLSNDGSSFPVVLFTSRVGVSTNMIYHVAMFLLLRHRPRATLSHESHIQIEAAKYPIWHARRVCSIALKSDPEHTQCWDPCMIAAFALTARQMTHPTQQKELLACLYRVKSSGWRVDSLVQSLRAEWELSNDE